ncbi:MAG: hypothetical protein WAT92_24200 [Saprospiraceae bacterium]
MDFYRSSRRGFPTQLFVVLAMIMWSNLISIRISLRQVKFLQYAAGDDLQRVIANVRLSCVEFRTGKYFIGLLVRNRIVHLHATKMVNP